MNGSQRESGVRRRLGGVISLLARYPRLYRLLRLVYHKTFFAGATHTVECTGLRCRFASPTPTIAEHIETLTGEQEILSDFLQELREGDIFWDVGASFGLYSVFGSARQEGRGRIVAIEPEPHMRTLLLRNISLNGLRNIEVLAVALGKQDGETTIYPSDSPNTGTTSMVQRSDYRLQQRGIVVPMYRGDTLAYSDAGRVPQVIKIDTEGAEGIILDGLKQVLGSEQLRAVYCEVHPRLLPLFGDTPEGVERRILDGGFAINARHSRGTEYHIICRRKP